MGSPTRSPIKLAAAAPWPALPSEQLKTSAGDNSFDKYRVGVRESAQSWRELLVDIKARGLAIPPEIAGGDGPMGFWKALDEAFPSTRQSKMLGS